MHKWILKAVVQKTISFLPYSNRINYLFQRYVTRGVELSDTYFGFKYEHLMDHLAFYRDGAGKADLRGEVCLELGTGWYPIVPIGCFLAGAEKVYSIDISPLLTAKTFLTAVEAIVGREAEFVAGLGEGIRDRFGVLKNIKAACNADTPLADLCKMVNLTPIVGDARRLDMGNETVSVITSNNTFEHVYPPILEKILAEMWRVLKPGGMMSHFIDMSDHFAHMDPSITIYNYLQYGERAWAVIDNSIQPQNRWRLPQYRTLYRALEIPYAEEKLRPGDVDAVRAMKLAPPYDAMPAEEVAISHGYMVSWKRGASSSC